MLTHHALTSDELIDAVSAFVSVVESDANESRTGQFMGPYKVIDQIGQGGMDAVFRAERSDGEFEHQVVIEPIGTHAFSPALIDRFRNERQILARLNHANIAKSLNAQEPPGSR